MPVVRESDQYLTINLINMLDLDSGEWAKNASHSPTSLDETEVSIKGITQQIRGIWFASPDKAEPALTPLEYSQQGDSITLKIPYLQYWDMVLIEWIK